MPADYDAFESAFADMVGTAGEQNVYENAPDSVADAEFWIDIFSETGIDFPSEGDTLDAFENFLVAFYPQEGMSPDDWWYAREEFYEMYGIDEHSIDWQAYREAIGYG